MESLPKEIILRILNHADFCASLSLAMAYINISPTIKELLFTINNSHWLCYAVSQKNNAMCQYLVDIGWKCSRLHLDNAALNGNYEAFDILKSVEVNRAKSIMILIRALESANIDCIRYVIDRYKIDNVDYYEGKLLYKHLCDNVELATDDTIKFIWEEYGITAIRAAKFGYFNIFKRYCSDRRHLGSRIISTAIVSGNIDIINYISDLGYIYKQYDAEVAVSYGNVAVLNWLIVKGYVDNYVKLQQIAIINDNFPMFKFIYKRKKEKTIDIFKTVFRQKNIEFMQYLHKHNWPICDLNQLTFTGIRYMHENMSATLTPQLYIIAISQNNIEFINYLTYNNIYPTKAVFNDAAEEYAPYATWKLLCAARKTAKKLSVWE